MEEETTGALLDRTSRATRGKRMTKLLDDEAEADEEFWGQDAFKEAAEDAEYEAEDDVVDEFDSDFDEDETNVEEEATDDDDERFRVKKKKLLPPGTKLFKKDKKMSTPKTKGLDVIEAAVAAAIQPMADEPTPVQVPLKQTQEVNDSIENLVDLEGEKTVRKSTRTAVVVRQAEREALQAAMQATTIKPVKKKREGERRITQEDMLLEAAQTEILNRQNLERMMAREEEVKQKAIVHKTVYSGPQIRFYSRDGKNFLEFMGAVAESEELFGQAKPSSRRPLACVVTGLPAKYVDPLTGLPYATMEAFKIIRERVDKEEYNQRELTPGKKRRSVRSFSGRPTVRKARRSILDAALRGYSFGMASGVEASPINIKANMKYDTQQPCLPDESRTQDSIIDLTAQSVHGPSPASLSKQLSETQASKHGPLDQSEGLEYAENLTHSAVGSDAPAVSLFQNLNMPLWVEIPPPREGPSEDDYSLDDLTSLNFGPILALQHGVTDHSEREHELDIDDPASVGTLLPLDLLPMPPDFGANVAL